MRRHNFGPAGHGYLVNLQFRVGYNTSSWSSENKQFMNNFDCEIAQRLVYYAICTALLVTSPQRTKEIAKVQLTSFQYFVSHSAILRKCSVRSYISHLWQHEFVRSLAAVQVTSSLSQQLLTTKFKALRANSCQPSQQLATHHG
jgi:hypothetical protein